MKFRFFTATAAALVLSNPVSSSALTQTFFGEDLGPGENPPGLAVHANADAARNSFLANLVGVGTETFESFAAGANNLNLTFPGAGTATLSGNGGVRSGHNGVGRYPISGTQWYEATDNFSIAFSAPVAAFGFYGVDVGDFNGRVTMSFVDGSSTTVTIPNSTGIAGGSVLYFGYINTDLPFTGITFGNTASGTDFFAFDDMTIGSIQQVQPPPPVGVPDGGTTAIMLGLGVAGLAFFRRNSCA